MTDRLDLATAPPTSIARAEIPRGERVIWADRAVASGRTWGSWGIVGFGLVFAGIGALWTLLAWAGTSSNEGLWRFFPLFGVPFVAIGLGVATSPFWARRVGGATIYALSDRRAFSISGRCTRVVRTIELDQIGNLHHVERDGGAGDIYFDGAFGDDPGAKLLRLRDMFGVPNVRRVVYEIDRLKQGLQRSGRSPGVEGQAADA